MSGNSDMLSEVRPISARRRSSRTDLRLVSAIFHSCFSFCARQISRCIYEYVLELVVLLHTTEILVLHSVLDE